MVEVIVLGISSSSREQSNTSILIDAALAGASSVPETESRFLPLREYRMEPCLACDRCPDSGTYCVIDDDMDKIYEQMVEADAIILGSPVHAYTLNARMKTLMERCRPLRLRGLQLKLKVGAAVAVGAGRNQGSEHAIHTLQNFMLTHLMLVVGGVRGAVGIAGVAYREATVQDDSVNHESYGELKTVHSARMLGKRVAVWARVLKEGWAGVDVDNLITHGGLSGE